MKTKPIRHVATVNDRTLTLANRVTEPGLCYLLILQISF